MKSAFFFFIWMLQIHRMLILARRVQVNINADDTYTVTFAGATIADARCCWDVIQTYTVDLEPGNYLFASIVKDNGGYAYFSASVTVDGLFLGQTDGSGVFRGATSVAAGWNTDLNYDDSSWTVLTANCGTTAVRIWSNINGVPTQALGFWLPNCNYGPRNTWFFRWKITIPPCPSNATCPGNSSMVCNPGYSFVQNNAKPCVPCQLGYYKSNINNQTCDPCAAGTYQPTTGQVSCLPCPVGTYQPASGRSSCLSCPSNATCEFPGLYAIPCEEGRFLKGSNCTDCSPGTFKPDRSLSECRACPSGTYQPFSGSAQCLPCPQGAFCTATQFTCLSGYYAATNASCEPCPTTMFKSMPGNQKCTTCPQNAQCSPDAFMCREGYWYNKDDIEPCALCPENFYKDTQGNGFCLVCPKNSICTVIGFNCLPGNRLNDNRWECEPCPLNHYKVLPDSTPTCTSCPSNSQCSSVGFQCYSGYTEVNGQCETCPENQYKPDIGNFSCAACPPHFECNTTSLIRCQNGFILSNDGTTCESSKANLNSMNAWLALGTIGGLCLLLVIFTIMALMGFLGGFLWEGVRTSHQQHDDNTTSLLATETQQSSLITSSSTTGMIRTATLHRDSPHHPSHFSKMPIRRGNRESMYPTIKRQSERTQSVNSVARSAIRRPLNQHS